MHHDNTREHESLLFDAMPQLGFTARPDGFVDYYNRRFYEYTGAEYEALQGWGWQSLIDAEELPRVAGKWNRCLATHAPFEETFPLRGQDGRCRWFLTRVIPIFDQERRLVRWIGINTDVDSLRREREARDILEHASAELVGSLDYDETLGRVAQAALPRFADMCMVCVKSGDAASPQIVARPVGRGLEELLLGVHVEVATTGVPQLVDDVTDDFLVRAAGSEQHLAMLRKLGCRSLLIVPLTARGKTFGALGFGITCSARRYDGPDLALAQELGRRAASLLENARLYGEANRTNLAKDEFLAMLGHELRNPLGPILTGLHLLRLKGLLGTSRELDAMQRQANHMVRLVDDLLDISRIASGKVSLQNEEAEISSVVATALEMVRSHIESGRHELRVSVPDHGLVVHVDVVRMSQVLANLLTNAAKFTPPGGQLTIAARLLGEAVEVRITDNGIGIAPELLPNVFEPFVQGRRSLVRTQGGLGLGLAIVKSLVTLHAGTVSASSAGLGQGSTFVVRLPVVQVPSQRALEGSTGRVPSS